MSELCGGEAVNALALVAYIPQPLGGFVDRVRRELAPGCRLRSHITILPPRQVACAPADAQRTLENAVSHMRAFRVEVKEVNVFSVSDVVYLSIGAGCQELRDLHAEVNRGPCLASEVWNYEPHLTLAQDLSSDAVAHIRGLAEQQWRNYAGPREFTLDRLTFVQSSPEGWVDLASWELLSPVLA